MCKQSLLQQPEHLPEPSNMIASFWCNICKLSCSHALNPKFHRLRGKHKAECEEVFGSKNTRLNENEVNESKNNEIVWCKECNVPCMKGAFSIVLGKSMLLGFWLLNRGMVLQVLPSLGKLQCLNTLLDLKFGKLPGKLGARWTIAHHEWIV